MHKNTADCLICAAGCFVACLGFEIALSHAMCYNMCI